MCGLDLSTREGDGHVVAMLFGEPGIAGIPAPLAAAAAREPQLILNWQACASRGPAERRHWHAGGSRHSVVVAGAILALPGMAGHAAGGHRHCY